MCAESQQLLRGKVCKNAGLQNEISVIMQDNKPVWPQHYKDVS